MISIPLDPPAAEVVKLNVPFKPPVAEEQFLVQAPHTCSHHSGPFLIDDTLAEVTCGRCKQKLNPMFVLKQLMYSESRWHASFARYQGEMKRLSERSKTKCEHCKKMTRISGAKPGSVESKFPFENSQI